MLEDLGGLFDFRPEDSATVMALAVTMVAPVEVAALWRRARGR